MSTTNSQAAANDDVVIKGRGVYTAYEGTAAADDLVVGGAAALYLRGEGGADTLVAGSNFDVLIGGAGVDTLTGGASRDNFVFTQLSDSYGGAGGSHSDLITDWTAEDRLDLTALDLTFEDLTIRYDAASDITYVRAAQADSSGNYFEVRLQGALSQALTAANFIARLDGTPGDDVLKVLPAGGSYVINGGEGNDTLTDGIDQDSTNTFYGGAGADTLLPINKWDDGAQDTFLYTALTDSFVNDKTGVAKVDLIGGLLDNRDVIDVSALGFTGLGDGHDGTLKVSYDSVHNYYVAESLDPDAQGNRFVLHFTRDTYYRDATPATHEDKGLFYFAGNVATAAPYNTVTGTANPGDLLIAGDEGAVLIGGGRGDDLYAGAGADTFVYLDRNDSVPEIARLPDPSDAYQDGISNFDTVQDKIDVSALGFTGLGDGNKGTLKLVYENNQTLLINNELSRDGSHFQVALYGDLSGSFTNANLITAAPNAPVIAQDGPRGLAYWLGSAASNKIDAHTSGASYLYGNAGNDVLHGSDSRDVLEGGTGVDTLTGGGTGGDTYVFKSVYDSYGVNGLSRSDLITDWNPASRLDLTALGLQRIGDGLGGDLAVSYDAAKGVTYLRSLEVDSEGNYFELRIQGDVTASLNTGNFVLRQDGTAADDTLDYHASTKQYVLNGGAGDDVLYGSKAAGNVLVGGYGADQLHGGSGADTYRYTALIDSLVNEQDNTQAVDLITRFAYGKGDLIDVSALGFTGLGDGYGNTLKYGYDAELGHVVVQSLEADNSGNRFVIDLDYAGRVSAGSGADADQFIFAAGGSTGSAYNTLTGSQAADVLSNPGESTVFVGGGGADRLIGSSAKDTFRFENASDSYRGQADLISGFEASKDKIDVAALGYTDLGDGTGSTLKVVYNENLDRTYVRSLEPDAAGHTFELALEGDVSSLAHRNFVFSSSATQAVDATGVVPADTAAVDLELLGTAATTEHSLNA